MHNFPGVTEYVLHMYMYYVYVTDRQTDRQTAMLMWRDIIMFM